MSRAARSTRRGPAVDERSGPGRQRANCRGSRGPALGVQTRESQDTNGAGFRLELHVEVRR